MSNKYLNQVWKMRLRTHSLAEFFFNKKRSYTGEIIAYQQDFTSKIQVKNFRNLRKHNLKWVTINRYMKFT